MFKRKQYFFLVICIFLALIIFFSDNGISSEISKEKEQNSPLNNQKLNNSEKTIKGEKNNFEILITPFVLGFGIFWAIISYFYRIVSFCLYPAIYILQTFYNIFIYKPYTVIRWVLSALFPVYLFCMVAAVLGCFVGGASGWLSEVIVTLLNKSSSNININNNKQNNNTEMIIDEDNINNDNNYYESINNDDNDNYNNNNNNNSYNNIYNNNDHYESNINYNNNNYYDYDEENNNDANSYYDDDRNSNYNNDTNISYNYNNFNDGNNSNFYEENNDINNNDGIEYNYNNDYPNYNIDDETTQRIIQENERKKCEKLRKRITALAEIKARNGGKLPDEIIAKYRKVRGESYSGYNSGVGGS